MSRQAQIETAISKMIEEAVAWLASWASTSKKADRNAGSAIKGHKTSVKKMQ